MLQLNLKAPFISLCLVWAMLCFHSEPLQAQQQQPADVSPAVRQLIEVGRKYEDINNDSLLIASNGLYQLNQQSNDNTALVYAELYEALYYWQAADHKRSNEIAVKCLSDALKLNIKQALPQIYALIGNLDKETSNFDMAFKAADNGLNAAINNNDTASTIALLGLKAMFIRSVTLHNHHSGLVDKSIDLNLQALKMAESSPKYEKLRIRFYDNICQFYKDTKDFNKAFYYGNKGVALAIKYNLYRSLTYSYCWLGEASYFTGKQAQGIDYLNKALQIAQQLNEPYRIMEIYESFYNCYNYSGNYKEAMHYYSTYSNVRDSLKVLDNVKQISELQVKYESARKDEKINNLNAADKIKTMELAAAILILFLLVVIGILYYIKEKKHKYLLLTEKSLIDTELKNATLELQYFTENLTQKNELIEEFKAKIEHLQNVNKADVEGLEMLVKEHIMTDESWENFKRLFTKVHTTFFNSIRQKFPNLTSTDTRMLSLVKLQLGNYEMANMLGVTIEGVKKSKQRLRKKMELEKEETLENIVDTL